MNNQDFFNEAFVRYHDILQDSEIKSKIKTDADKLYNKFTNTVAKECIEAYEKETKYNLYDPRGMIGIAEEYNWF